MWLRPVHITSRGGEMIAIPYIMYCVLQKGKENAAEGKRKDDLLSSNG